MTLVSCYTSPMSGYPGDTIQVCASASPNSRLQMEFCRLGDPDVILQSEDVDVDYAAPPGDCFSAGCGWSPVYNLVIPIDWPSGIYSVRFLAEEVIAHVLLEGAM
jgi:hypothetical protein